MEKTTILTIFLAAILAAFSLSAGKTDIDIREVGNKPSKGEVGTEPSATYDDATNSIEMAIEAEEQFKLKVIDSTGKTVYACSVMMSGGVPVNYIHNNKKF